MRFTSPTDAVMGVLLLALGGAGVVLSSKLPMGTAMRMGPGYFPTLVCWILVGFGVVIFLRSLVISGPALEGGKARPIVFVLAAVATFALGIEHLGLFATIVLMASLAAGACAESRPIEVVVAALALGLFSCGLFIGLLGLPMRWQPAFPGL